MTRIFAIGVGPLLGPGVQLFSGQALRTTHFIKPLRNAGHEIDLYLHPISDLHFNPESDSLATGEDFEDLAYTQLQSNKEELLLPFLQERLDEFQPDALLGINSFPAHLACRLNTLKPIWCDLNGYGMVEAQTHARVYDSDDCLPHFLRHERTFARRGDRFSTVSVPQKYALMGELALWGRLNKYTFDYDFVTPIPEAVAERFLALDSSRRPAEDEKFRVYWCGSFNTWTDVDLLFNALSQAMDQAPELHFVATGGAIEGHNEVTYARFSEMVDGSPHRDRFSLLGWVEPEVVDELLLKCDLGINIDSWNYDTMFGARNRINTMIGCRMPVLTTLGTEVSHELHQHGLGFFVEIGDLKGCVEQLVHAAEHREELHELGRRSRQFALEAWSIKRTTRKCVEWMAAPQHAPDNAHRLQEGDPALSLPLRPLNIIERQLAQLEMTPLSELKQDHADLCALRGKRLYRLAKKMKLV